MFDAFANDVERTANPAIADSERLFIGVLGLAGEAGEACDWLKKYRGQGHPFNKNEIINELGDILYYVFYVANTLGVDVEYILEENMLKRQKRYPEGFDPDRSINRDSH